jgi:sugar lactone lactonase YvrE
MRYFINWFAASSLLLVIWCSESWAVPAGYQVSTVTLNAAPSGLAYAADGTLFALESPALNTNIATVRVITPSLSFGPSLTVTGLDTDNLFVGSMIYNDVADELLITDNTPEQGALYSLKPDGTQTTILDAGLARIAGVAVRSTGEIFVSTAPSDGGAVYQIDRINQSTNLVLSGLGFGAGLAFDPHGDLIVQDTSTSFPYPGRLQRLPITESSGTLSFGTPIELATGMQAGAGLIVDSEGDIYTTGPRGLFESTGSPLVTTNFDANGSQNQYATAISFFSGDAAFEPFAGGTSRLAYLSDFGFADNSPFVTIISPVPEPTTGALLCMAVVGLGVRRQAWAAVSRRRRR